MSKKLTEQMDWDLVKCKQFSIKCDETVDSSSTSLLMMFIQMVFDDFSTKEERLTQCPLRKQIEDKTEDIYNNITK